jgi:tetratricopeptide (TPR) repeat protein
MSKLDVIADNTAQICVAAFALASSTAAAPVIAPLAVLGTLAGASVLRSRASCTARAADAALAALREVPELSGANLGRVEALLADRTRDVDLGPAALIRAAREGDPARRDGFVVALVEGLMAAVATDPGEERERRLVEAAFGAAVRCLMGDPGMQAGLQATLLLQAVRDQFTALGMLADIARVQQVEAALAAARHAEVMARLALTEELRRLHEAGITDAAIVALYDKAGVLAAEPQEQWRQFLAFVDSAVRLQAEAKAGTNLGDWVDRVIAEAARLARGGDNRGAAEMVERALAEEAAESSARQMWLINTALLHRLQVPDAKGAADLLVKRLDVEAGGRADFLSFLAEKEIWRLRGRDQGLALEQEVAISFARCIVGRAADPDQRIIALSDLAVTLVERGERETGFTRLHEAVEILLGLVNDHTRAHQRLLWALAQMNLGNAFFALAEREADTEYVEKAVSAHVASLHELTREGMPILWALAQMNLGNSLVRLGERQKGTARLEEGVVALRGALGVLEREREPHYWTPVQVNLGCALATVAQRTFDMSRFEQAATAFRAALSAMDPIGMSTLWSQTQMNLGNVLRTIGQRESGTERLEEAVALYSSALSVHCKDDMPLSWALTQLNLSGALVSLFDRTGDPSKLAAAQAAARAARGVFEEVGAALYHSDADARLADIAARRAPLTPTNRP